MSVVDKRPEPVPPVVAPDADPAQESLSPAVLQAVVADAQLALLACLRAGLAAPDWRSSAAEVVADISHRLGCLRVSLGWIVAGELQVIALSDGVVLEEGAAIPELQQAMLEALHQHATLTWPPTPQCASRITLAHQFLFKAQGLAGVVSVPMAHGGRVTGVINCERSVVFDPLRPSPRNDLERAAFSAHEVHWLSILAEGLAPMMAMRYRLDRSWWDSTSAGVLTLIRRIKDPTERGLRWSLGGVAAALLVGVLVPLPYHVTASARLEGAVKRVLSASEDGFLREVHVRPGDLVKAGQVLAELSDDDLQNARRARVADLAQQENAFAEAFAQGDHAQAATAQTKVAESRAQLALVEQQLARVKLVAPFDGVVIQGDLRQQLGAPVKRGETLLTLAPGLDWRVVLEVDESEVSELQAGQVAGLRLSAMPGQVISLLLERVTPVAKPTADGVRYEVEAIPTGAGAGLAGLRPGLQGVAQIELTSRPLLQRWALHGWQWLRMLAWKWL